LCSGGFELLFSRPAQRRHLLPPVFQRKTDSQALKLKSIKAPAKRRKIVSRIPSMSKFPRRAHSESELDPEGNTSMSKLRKVVMLKALK
jgi:hypothetical protein